MTPRLMPTPGFFGLVHLMTILLMVFIMLAFGKKEIKKTNKERVLLVLVIFYAILLAGFIYKQTIFYLYGDSGNTYVGKFNWEVFPWQVCDTPLFLMPFLIGFYAYDKKKVADALFCFVATFCLIGGLAPILVPAGLYTDRIGTNIETVIHHYTMVLCAFYIFKTQKLSGWRNIIISSIIFTGYALLGLMFNIAFHKASGGAIGALYINPYVPTRLPVFGAIQKVSYVLFFITYLVVFCGISAGFYFLGINKDRIRKWYRSVYDRIPAQAAPIALFAGFVLLNIITVSYYFSPRFLTTVTTFEIPFRYKLLALLADLAIFCFIGLLTLLYIKRAGVRFTVLLLTTVLISTLSFAQFLYAKYYNVTFVPSNIEKAELSDSYLTMIVTKGFLNDFLYFKLFRTYYSAVALSFIYFLGVRKFKELQVAAAGERDAGQIIRRERFQRPLVTALAFAFTFLFSLSGYAGYKRIYRNNWEIEAGRSVLASQTAGKINYFLYEGAQPQPKHAPQLANFFDYAVSKTAGTNLLGGASSALVAMSEVNNLTIDPALGWDGKPYLNGIFAGKTLVYVQLESFYHELLGRGAPDHLLRAAPGYLEFTRALIAESYLIDNLYHAVGVGHSADGGLAALTGFYPTGHSISYYRIDQEKYQDAYSLPRLFKAQGYATYAFEGASSDFYNMYPINNHFYQFDHSYYFDTKLRQTDAQYNCFVKYRDNLLPDFAGHAKRLTYNANPASNVDDLMLPALIWDNIKGAPGPKFINPVTLHPHAPFNDVKNPYKHELLAPLSPEGRGYFSYANYLDATLREFHRLAAKMPDTVFIFYSDHCPNGFYKKDLELLYGRKLSKIEYEVKRNHMTAFIYVPDHAAIARDPATPKGLFKGVQNLVRSQTDLYRTVVDLFFAPEDVRFAYFGANLLSREQSLAIEPKRLTIIADDFQLLGASFITAKPKKWIYANNGARTERELYELYLKIKNYKAASDAVVRGGLFNRAHESRAPQA